MREAHVPTQQPTPPQEARIPASHADPRRPGSPEGSSPQGPQAARRLIRRIHDHATFAQLGRARRWSRGPVWIRALPGTPDQPPRIAYAIGRAVGGAVQRNRLRRRLRAVFAARSADLVPGGAFLVGARADALRLDAAALDQLIAELLEAIRQELT